MVYTNKQQQMTPSLISGLSTDKSDQPDTVLASLSPSRLFSDTVSPAPYPKFEDSPVERRNSPWVLPASWEGVLEPRMPWGNHSA